MTKLEVLNEKVSLDFEDKEIRNETPKEKQPLQVLNEKVNVDYNEE